MNIFFLHKSAEICAGMHCDKHVVKMILETAQLLSSVHYMTDSHYKPVYKLTHKNHPCSIWSRESLGNYLWLCELGIELCKEYTYRYLKIHKSQEYIAELTINLPPIIDKGITTIRQAMPDIYKNVDPTKAYRDYYIAEKSRLFSWKNRPKPFWIPTDLMIKKVKITICIGVKKNKVKCTYRCKKGDKYCGIHK
jgi:hypothetical protein